jgi:hypothetical protein
MRVAATDVALVDELARFNPDARRDVEALGDAGALAEYDRAEEELSARYDEALAQAQGHELQAAMFGVMVERSIWVRAQRTRFQEELGRRRERFELSASARLTLTGWCDETPAGPPALDTVARPVLAHAPPSRACLRLATTGALAT